MESTLPKFFCFVLMPFTPDFDDIYTYGIKESCKDADAYCERVDEQIFHERILDRIYNQIAKADLIIADMTGRNPNVFYEVGYAHALNKPTVLLTQNADDIPFDLKHFPHIIYENKISIIRNELTKRILWSKQNNSDTGKHFKTGIDLFVEDKNLSDSDAAFHYENNHYPNFKLTIHNSSAFTYNAGDFQVGVITKEYESVQDRNIVSTHLPDGTFLHMLPKLDTLFPNAYNSYQVTFKEQHQSIEYDANDINLIIRVFTEGGSRDYNLRLVEQKMF